MKKLALATGIGHLILFLPGSPTEYLQNYVFPTLIPAMERMLEQAKKEKCFEV